MNNKSRSTYTRQELLDFKDVGSRSLSSGYEILGPDLESKTEKKPLKSKSAMVRGISKSAGVSLPRVIDSTMTVTIRIYYDFSDPSARTITVASLLLACGAVGAVLNSSLQSIYSSVRIKRITIWPAPSTGSANTSELLWAVGASAYQKDSEKIRPIPEGVSVTGATVYKPNKNTLAADWLTNSVTGTVFTVSSATGSVLLLEAAATLANAITSVPTMTVTSCTVPTLYWPRLDGHSGKIVPFGLNSTD